MRSKNYGAIIISVALILINGCYSVNSRNLRIISVEDVLSKSIGSSWRVRGYLRLGDDYTNLWQSERDFTGNGNNIPDNTVKCLTLSIPPELRDRMSGGQVVTLTGTVSRFEDGELDSLWSCSGLTKLDVSNVTI